MQSLGRNLANEDAAADRNIRYHENILSDGEVPNDSESSETGDPDMQILAARDVYFNTDQPRNAVRDPSVAPIASASQGATQAPSQPSQAAGATPGVSNGVLSKLSPLTLAAIVGGSALAGGLPAAALTYFTSRPATVDPTNYELHLLPAIKENTDDTPQSPSDSGTGYRGVPELPGSSSDRHT